MVCQYDHRCESASLCTLHRYDRELREKEMVIGMVVTEESTIKNKRTVNFGYYFSQDIDS